MASKRLSDIASHIVSRPSSDSSEIPLPTYDELPSFKDFPGCAWGVWGRDDQLGTVNLLTEAVVQRAATEEIRLGRMISLNWPIHFPEKPLFSRKTPEINMKIKRPELGMPRDDEIHINTQSGTQWDGLRHIGLFDHGVFYNNTDAKSMRSGVVHIPDPNDIDPSLARIGIQNWAKHGICGRGVFLDLVGYYTRNGGELPYDPWTTHPITVAELETVAKHQGVEFRRGDILLLRVGFIQKYYKETTAARQALSQRPETFAGIEQSENMKKFLWNNHFAAIASDQPALECWPASRPQELLHQTILGLWGMPLGELFDLEELSKTCAETGRYTFFFTSWPLNIIGGCASPPNAAHLFFSIYPIPTPSDTMSRRESRSSLGARQNDALFEFENFKKKFLLANKHITKLNSTLSVRIEELNAQISTLYVENLRLRASEIALAAQLKREREKSRKILEDTEIATQNLVKHLNYLRHTHNVKTTSDTPQAPPSPKARRPVLNVDTSSPTSPQFIRISRPPNVPGIYEEEEPRESSEEKEKQSSPSRKKTKSKPRLSASKVPVLARAPSPTPSSTKASSSHLVEAEPISAPSKPRKTLRRQSGLLRVNTESLSVPRAGSPAFGSPIRLEAGRAEEEEELAAVHGQLEVTMDQDVDPDRPVKKEKKKGKGKEQRESESEKDAFGEVVQRPKEKKKPRDEEDAMDNLKPKVKDVAPRTALQPIDSNVKDQTDMEPRPPSARQFLQPGSPVGSAPTSRGSSSPAPPASSETEGLPNGVTGRERRVRKSVNYAEPKLNTKMRKPDPPPGAEPPRKKRSSAAAVMTSTSYKPTSSSSQGTAADVISDRDPESEARSPLDMPSAVALPPVSLPLRGTDGSYINPELFPLPASRPGSAAALYSPTPPARTSGSTTSGATVVPSSSSSSSLSSTTTVHSLKRKKSKPQSVISDDESDGAEADEEYMGGGSRGMNAWVNVEGRRKALPKRSAATAAVAALEDIRRHSIAF